MIGLIKGAVNVLKGAALSWLDVQSGGAASKIYSMINGSGTQSVSSPASIESFASSSSLSLTEKSVLQQTLEEHAEERAQIEAQNKKRGRA